MRRKLNSRFPHLLTKAIFLQAIANNLKKAYGAKIFDHVMIFSTPFPLACRTETMDLIGAGNNPMVENNRQVVLMTRCCCSCDRGSKQIILDLKGFLSSCRGDSRIARGSFVNNPYKITNKKVGHIIWSNSYVMCPIFLYTNAEDFTMKKLKMAAPSMRFNLSTIIIKCIAASPFQALRKSESLFCSLICKKRT